MASSMVLPAIYMVFQTPPANISDAQYIGRYSSMVSIVWFEENIYDGI